MGHKVIDGYETLMKPVWFVYVLHKETTFTAEVKHAKCTLGYLRSRLVNFLQLNNSLAFFNSLSKAWLETNIFFPLELSCFEPPGKVGVKIAVWFDLRKSSFGHTAFIKVKPNIDLVMHNTLNVALFFRLTQFMQSSVDCVRVKTVEKLNWWGKTDGLVVLYVMN